MASVEFLAHYANLWSAAASIVTASSAVVSLPPAATQNTQRTSVWRSTLESAPAIQVDLANTLDATRVALADFRVVQGTLSTLKLQWSADGSSGWTDAATLPTVDAEAHTQYAAFGTLTKRYWRLLATPTAGTIQIEIGYIFLGTITLAPTKDPLVPLGLGLVDDSVVTLAIAGQESVAQRPTYLSGSLFFRNATTADRLGVNTLVRSQTGPTFLVVTPSVTWTTLLVNFHGGVLVESRNPSRHNLEVPFTEAR